MATSYESRGLVIRAEMVEALQGYAQSGCSLGGFLTAVICNNLGEASSRADADNFKNLGAFAVYLYNEMPQGSWGSPEKVEAWMARGGLRGRGDGP